MLVWFLKPTRQIQFASKMRRHDNYVEVAWTADHSALTRHLSLNKFGMIIIIVVVGIHLHLSVFNVHPGHWVLRKPYFLHHFFFFSPAKYGIDRTECYGMNLHRNDTQRTWTGYGNSTMGAHKHMAWHDASRIRLLLNDAKYCRERNENAYTAGSRCITQPVGRYGRPYHRSELWFSKMIPKTNKQQESGKETARQWAKERRRARMENDESYRFSMLTDVLNFGIWKQYSVFGLSSDDGDGGSVGDTETKTKAMQNENEEERNKSGPG